MSAGWPRIARRIRVPLGFLFAAAYLYFARPAWWAMVAGAAIMALGLALRALASGHVRKDREVTTSGPYSYTRNPLYLGSILVAIGFVLAARNWWIALAAALLFALIYLPTIRSEEQYLRATFPEFADYEQRVPRLLPRFARIPLLKDFSRELYLKHREYNAALGAAAMMLALLAKLLWFNH